METLGKHFQKLAKAALERHGFAQADLLSQWSVVAGDVSAYAVPEQIKWPRAFDGHRKMGGTLVVKVNPGRGLDAQYQVPQLIERVNQFLGFGAIAAVKIIQSGTAVAHAPAIPSPPPVASPSLREQVANIENEGLKSALLQLGAALETRRSPQLTKR